MSTRAILTDVTRCIGCEACVAACQDTNHIEPGPPRPWTAGPGQLSEYRWTTVVRGPRGRYVRLHCRHCLDPACASACPVGALHRADDGAVVYDADICMGCRYCMIACPFGMTRYEWSSPTPRIRKCIMCHDKVAAGEIDQPACTSACPTQATIFGDRDALLAEARARIRAFPDRYLPHVWGEEEVGGTSVLMISDVDLATAGWPHGLRRHAYPDHTAPALRLVPGTFATVGVAMLGLSWIIGRRRELEAGAAEPDTDDAARATDGDARATDGDGADEDGGDR